MKNSRIIAVGLALFSMFFGAGNIIFPLILGQKSGDLAPFAVFGMCLTAIAIPMMGAVGTLLFKGDTEEFFGRIGRVPGLILIGLIMALIGPFGGLPRCIALSYSTMSYAIPHVDATIFCLAACAVIFVLCFKRERLTEILGYVLTPLLLLSIIALLILGFFTPSTAPAGVGEIGAGGSAFYMGLKQGYQTLDLLASFFFSSILLQTNFSSTEGRSFLKPLLTSCAIAGALLGVIYAGLCLVASKHLIGVTVANDQLMAYLAFHLLGSAGGYLSISAVALACLTTAISLAAIFSLYIQKEIFKERIAYRSCLVLTLVIAFFFSLLRFNGIVSLIAPILEICYPALLLLTMLNIAYKMRDFRPVKTPVSLAFLWGLLTYAIR